MGQRVLPTVRVNFSNSTHIDVTESHPMWAKSNWTGRSKYRKIPLNEIDITRKHERKVPTSMKIMYNERDIEWLTEDHCFIIGHFLAEGCTTDSNMCTSGYSVISEVIPKLEKLGIPFSQTKNNSGVPVIRFLKSPFQGYIKAMLNNSFDMELKQELLYLPKRKLQAILDGYFCGDGHFHKRGNAVEKIYSTSCEKFALQLHEISLKWELLSISTSKRSTGIRKEPIYRVHDNPNSEFRRDYDYNDISETVIKKMNLLVMFMYMI
jgi:intein/homing endonuclease